MKGAFWCIFWPIWRLSPTNRKSTISPFTIHVPSLLTNYWSLHPVNLVLTDIRTEIPITVSIIEVFSRVSIGQCFNFQNYTVFSRACTQNNNTESPNLWLSHLQNGVFSYFISIVIILGPPAKLAQTPLPLEDTICFGGVWTTIILFSDFPEFVSPFVQTQGAQQLWKWWYHHWWRKYNSHLIKVCIFA